MLILSETDVQKCLDMKSCLAVNRTALRVIATGEAVVPTRIGIPYHDDWSLFKPASLPSSSHLGIKVVSVRGDNPAIGLPQVPATILHMNYHTGIVEAVLGGTYLTAARTAAGSALAVQYHCAHLHHLVLFGAGLQAQLHLEAILTAMQLPRVPRLTIVNRSAASARTLLDANRDRFDTANVVLLSDPIKVLECLASADAVCACTSSKVALWPGDTAHRLPEQCVITAVGSYSPDRREIPPETIASCSVVYMDTMEAKNSGDLHDADETKQQQLRLLGEILAADPDPSSLSSSSTKGRVFYKSVGTAIQDVMTAAMVVENAKQLGIGQTIDMS
jgi:ornithine cyclodeaminase